MSFLNPDFRLRAGRGETEPRLLRHYTWGSIITTGVGLATSMYGANKNAKAQKAADAQARTDKTAADNENYRRFLLTKGIDSNTGGAVNTRLPLWAGVIRSPSGVRGVRMASLPGPAATGTATPSTRTWGGLSGGRRI